MNLRRVDDERPPLDPEELRELGNDLLSRARVAAVDAVRASMHSDFLARDKKSLGRADVLGWRERARESIAAWREVESLTTELLNEIDRTRESARPKMHLIQVAAGKYAYRPEPYGSGDTPM